MNPKSVDEKSGSLETDNNTNTTNTKPDSIAESNTSNTNQPEVSRRNFLRLAGVGITASVASGCEIDLGEMKPSGGEGWLPAQYDASGNFPVQVRGRIPIDPKNPSITRDDQKCILCGQCVEVCAKVETVMHNYELPLVDDIPCICCGQCTLWCPTGAITEVDDTLPLMQAITNPNLHVVVQTAPSTRVALGEEFGLPVGTNVEGNQVAALKRLGFDKIFDTNFSADLTIMEEGTELVKRITGEKKAPLPQLTSCCPGWVKYCEYFFPDLIPNLSSAKSPMTMMGAMIKTYYAEKSNINPKDIFSVAIMPCTAKKFEAIRPEMNHSGLKNGDPAIRDIDLVLTTRELAKLIKREKIDFVNLPSEKYDSLMSEYSGAGVIFGATGGVMEAAVRTAYHLLAGEPPKLLFNLEPVRGLAGVKEAKLNIPNVGDIKIAVVSGMHNTHKILEKVRNGEGDWHFIEFMACPGGCISGGGQPRSAVPPSDSVRTARSNALYTADEKATIRLSYENHEIKAIYENYLGKPNGELPHDLLHTSYSDRSKHLTAKIKK
ncbi:MAG: [FeFe] hydrogenase, group A [Planctomycetaceae bacterium]|jgi:iron-only hydrogenase group A|nr:[FeFe] hydrogenase, group A [Planctomycetaceae bacterium]